MSIKINVNGVMSASGLINSAKFKISSAATGVSDIRGRIDGSIKSRCGIEDRLNSIVCLLNSLDSEVGNIKAVVERGASQYDSTDNRIINMKDAVISRYSEIAKPTMTQNRLQFEAKSYIDNNLNKPKKEKAVSDFIKDGVDYTDKYGFGAFQLFVNYIKSKPALSGMKIVEKNGCWYIKGLYSARKNIDVVKNIKGTKYRIGSDAFKRSGLYRLNPSGTSALENIKKFKFNIMEKEIWKDSFKDFGKKIYKFEKGDALGNIGKVIGYGAIAFETGSGIYDNINNGASTSKIVADATVDVAKGLGSMAIATGCAQVGAAVGTAIPIPVVGTLVGAAVGFGVGIAANVVYDNLIDGVQIGGKTAAGWASYGIEKGIDATVDGAKKLGNKVENVLKSAEKSISTNLEAAKKNVAGAFCGLGKFVFG